MIKVIVDKFPEATVMARHGVLKHVVNGMDLTGWKND
jgi:hypothetical protein